MKIKTTPKKILVLVGLICSGSAVASNNYFINPGQTITVPAAADVAQVTCTGGTTLKACTIKNLGDGYWVVVDGSGNFLSSAHGTTDGALQDLQKFRWAGVCN